MKYCDEYVGLRLLSVCPSVCLSVVCSHRLSAIPNNQTSRNFLSISAVADISAISAVTQCSSDDSVLRYVLRFRGLNAPSPTLFNQTGRRERVLQWRNQGFRHLQAEAMRCVPDTSPKSGHAHKLCRHRFSMKCRAYRHDCAALDDPALKCHE